MYIICKYSFMIFYDSIQIIYSSIHVGKVKPDVHTKSFPLKKMDEHRTRPVTFHLIPCCQVSFLAGGLAELSISWQAMLEKQPWNLSLIRILYLTCTHVATVALGSCLLLSFFVFNLSSEVSRWFQSKYSCYIRLEVYSSCKNIASTSGIYWLQMVRNGGPAGSVWGKAPWQIPDLMVSRA